MTVYDIEIGSIAVAKDGEKYEVLDAYYYNTPISRVFRLDLKHLINANFGVKDENMYPRFEYEVIWVGTTIKDLNKTFIKIGDLEIV